MLYLEKGEYDDELKWPIPEEFEFELVPTPEPQQTEVEFIVYDMEICARCGSNLNRTENEQEVEIYYIYSLKQTPYLNMTVKKHFHFGDDFSKIVPPGRETREGDF